MPVQGKGKGRLMRKRPTIGIFSADLLEFTGGRELLSAVADFAAVRDCNALYIAGAALKDPRGFIAQNNIIYDRVRPSDLDGLMIWGSVLGSRVGFDELMRFCDYFHQKPITCMGLRLPGIPSVLMASYQGMHDLMTHMVKVHGYRRLAVIRGPEGHHDTEERLRAYRDVLQEYGIPYDPKLISEPGYWFVDHGEKSIHLFLDERRIEADAIICTSDFFVPKVLEVLRGRGIRIPEQMAVTGFDNNPFFGSFDLPLTTVSIGMYQRGTRALEMLLQLINGVEVPMETVSPCYPIFRRSCGCDPLLAPAVRSKKPLSGSSGKGLPADQVLLARRTEVLEKMRGILTWNIGTLAPGWEEQLFGSFVAELRAGLPGSFGNMLLEWVRGRHNIGTSFNEWYTLLEAFQPQSEWGLDEPALFKTLGLLSHARSCLQDFEIKLEQKKWLQTEIFNRSLVEIGLSLATAFSIHEICDVLAKALPDLGIGSCYLYLYDNTEPPPKAARLILGYKNHQRLPIDSEGDGGQQDPAELFPALMHPKDRSLVHVVVPLYYRENHQGYVLMEVGPTQGNVFATLQTQISSALWVAAAFAKEKLTEQALAIQARDLARSNYELEQFAYAASHDLREPLQKMIVFGDRLMKTAAEKLNEHDRDYLQRIVNSALRLHRLINDLLAFSRLSNQTGPLAPVNLTEVVQGVLVDLELMVSEKNAVIDLGKLPVIEAEPSQMQQLFINLIANSLKFQRKEILPAVKIFAHPLGEGWQEIVVEDNGIGIDSVYHERIFGIFERLHSRDEYEGSGIGLAICKRIVERHQGRIVVESEPGKGTRFRVQLPEKQ
jgi:signal transduction histidine kinase